MADDKYYCGCGHSAWGLLLLFSVVQVFLTSSLFPGIVEIFDASVHIRSSRTAVESAATELDKWRIYDTGVSTDPNALAAAAAGGVPQTTPPNWQYLQLKKTDAQLVFDTVMARYLNAISYPTYPTGSTVYGIPTYVNASGFTETGQIYLQFSTAFALSDGTRQVTTSVPPAINLGNAVFTTARNISGLKVETNYEKQLTTFITGSLARTEAFAAFFFLQWVIGLAFFGVALKKYAQNAAPTPLPALAVVGLLLIFFGWVVGWYYNSPWLLNSLFSTFLSGSIIGSFGAQPFVGLLILVWILLFIYAHYSIQWVNGGGKEEEGQYSPPPPAATGNAANASSGGGFMSTFKNMTGGNKSGQQANLAPPPASPYQPSASGSYNPNASGNYGAAAPAPYNPNASGNYAVPPPGNAY
jgi:hypothetical protein